MDKADEEEVLQVPALTGTCVQAEAMDQQTQNTNNKDKNEIMLVLCDEDFIQTVLLL
jgi:hypothetical protein